MIGSRSKVVYRRESGTILIRRFRLENLDRDQNGIRPSNHWSFKLLSKTTCRGHFEEPFITITT